MITTLHWARKSFVVPAIVVSSSALLWLAALAPDAEKGLTLMVLSLAAAARRMLSVLDRRAVDGMWVRLAWVTAGAVIGIAIWGVIFSWGHAIYPLNAR